MDASVSPRTSAVLRRLFFARHATPPSLLSRAGGCVGDGTCVNGKRTLQILFVRFIVRSASSSMKRGHVSGGADPRGDAMEAQAIFDASCGSPLPYVAIRPVWSPQAEVPIRDYADAGRRAVEGQLEALHLVRRRWIGTAEASRTTG